MKIESFCKLMGNQDNIWYATNIEIVGYTKALRSLVFTVDQDIVYNSTLIDVWFTCNDKEYLWNANPVYWWKHAPLLFPTIGTLKNNQLSFEGKDYKMGVQINLLKFINNDGDFKFIQGRYDYENEIM